MNYKIIIFLLSIWVGLAGNVSADILTKVGAMGDSLSDENLLPEDGNYKNWIMHLVNSRGVNFGTNYAWNYALSGATTETLLSQGQHTNLAAQNPSLAILWIGGNDMGYNYYLADPAPDPVAFALERAANFRTAVETVAGTPENPTGTKMVLFNMPNVTATPVVREFIELEMIAPEKVPLGIQMMQRYNEEIVNIAEEYGFPLIDSCSWIEDITGPADNPNTSIQIGGVEINLQGHPDDPSIPTDGWTQDGFHPYTVLQGLIANGVISAINQTYDAGLMPLSDQEILQSAGITDIPAGTSYYDISDYVLVPVPEPMSLMIFAGLGFLGLKYRRV